MTRVETIGDCTLYLGDCLEVLPGLNGIDAVVTDPPYGINGGQGGQARERGKGKYNADGWNDSEEYIAEVVAPTVHNLTSRCKRMAITTGIRCMGFYPRPNDIGCFWTPAGVGVGPWGFTVFQPILYYGRDYRAGRGSLPAGIQVTERAEQSDHPCPKPIRAWTWLVEKASMPGETVLDPFMGSGTTGVACVKTGRKFIGIEIDAGYFDIACKRIAAAYEQLPLLAA